MAHSPTERLLTAEDLYELEDDGFHHYELDEGRLVVSEPPGLGHGNLALRIGARLLAFVEPRGLGVVSVESGFVMRRGPDTVHGPDVAFVRRDRAPAPDTPEFERFVEGHPDLAVEIYSPSDRPGRLGRKVAGYLARGTGLVWVVYPRRRLVVSHTPDGATRLVRPPEALDGGDVLPGFTLPAGDLFANY
jgi:Uma2 family endonuclease